MTFGRITALLGVITAFFVALILMYPDMRWALPVAASEQAIGIDFLFRLMLIVSTGIFIFVQGFLIYFVWLYRRRPEDPEDAIGRNLHGDNRLEIAWTVAPALFLVVLTILSYSELQDLKLDEVVPGSHLVKVEAYQFAWSFTHPDTGISEANVLTLQKDVPVTFEITSRDVNHAFWVPEFRLKQDATNGFYRRINITPNMTHQEGGYPDGFPLRCAELCGAGHSVMLAKVHVLEANEYQAWQVEKLSSAAPSPDASPEEIAEYGIEVYQNNGCIGCHVLDVAGGVGAVGPTHNGLANTIQERINDPAYAGSATTVEEYLIESVREPNAYVVEGFNPGLMQPYTTEQISDEDLQILILMLLQQQQ
ncbi:MAG: cytochrome c oxidase subunit II [Ardenticatenaceae bacterium]